MEVVNHVYYDTELGETINVCVLDLDTGINEQVRKNKDGSMSIFINARSSYDRQQEGFTHARKHIKDGDWEKFYVQDIEAHAHDIIVTVPIKNDRYEELGEVLRAERIKAKKKLDRYYKKVEKRRRAFEKFGVYEEQIIVEDEFGVPVVKTVHRYN